MLRPIVRTGLDVLADQAFAPLRGLRVGVVTNAAGVDARLRHLVDLLQAVPHLRLTAVFGPEHGFCGEAQDLVSVESGIDRGSGFAVHSLYGNTESDLRPAPETLRGLDVLVIDLPDIGTRYYTFQATMLYCLETAARYDLPVVVLDRPNPLNGVDIEGPAVAVGFESFVGPHSIPTRHGMTLGELAEMYRIERNLAVTLHVVGCEGWRRDYYYDETHLPWVIPSPNMPTLDTAMVYAGACLLEGTNISEGRGTTRPFELCGAPWIDSRKLADRLGKMQLPGVVFRPVQFRPTFHKFAGQSCGGVQWHITDRVTFRPVRTGVAVLSAFAAESGKLFHWRTEPYEFVDDKPAIDILFGSSRERMAIQAGLSWQEVARSWQENESSFRARRERFLFYM